MKFKFLWFILAIIFTSALFSACGGSDDIDILEGQNPLWRKYIRSYSSGHLSKKSNIVIKLAQDIIDPKSVGKTAKDIIEIEPAIDASMIYKNTGEILITPKKQLKPGGKYKVTVKIKKLIKIPEELGDFLFSFQVIEQEFEVKISGLRASSSSDNKMFLKGSLITADAEDPKKIEQILSATYRKKPVNMIWKHSGDEKHHDFTITGLRRQKKKKFLKVSWNGKGIGVRTKGKKNIEVPAIGAFKVTDVKAINDAQQYVLVYFSDRIKQNQNLKGLVSLNKKGFTSKVEGNTIKIFMSKKRYGKVKVTLSAAIKNKNSIRLKTAFIKYVVFKSNKPQVRFVGKGVILPDNDVLSIPFEGVNIRSVQLTAFLIYDKNIGQFFQTNKLEGSEELSRVGRFLWRKTIYLPGSRTDKWNRYTLDATKLLQNHPGGIFRLSLSINRSNATYDCTNKDSRITIAKEEAYKNYDDLYVQAESGWDYAEDYYDEGQGNDNSTWADRDNPCKDAYYKYAKGVKVEKNFLASNIGIIAKVGKDKKIHVITTHIDSSEPMKNVNLTFMNFQNQLMAKTTTDGDGFAETKLSGKAFYCIADKAGQKGYLKMNDGSALPVSHFDVGGEKVEAGIKGHIYGERGVWRPGDKIHLTFVLEDKNDKIPDYHPVTMKLYDPRGQFVKTSTNNKPVHDFYKFTMRTSSKAPTGNWQVKALLGGSTFTKKLAIETIKPNRLKVELDFDKETLYYSDKSIKAKIFGQWLHGALASALKTDVKVQLRSVKTKFSRFTDHNFDDPVRKYRGESQDLFEGKLDDKGYATVDKKIILATSPPGRLSAYFTTRVFERGGNFSSSRKKITYHPYKNYVGIKLPKGDQKRDMLLTDKDHTVSIASLDDHGNPVSLDEVEVSLYKISWKWWWDKSGDSLAEFESSGHTKVVKQGTISTSNGQGKWTFKVKYPTWGRYLLRVCDTDGGHCSGKVFFIDWPGWAGRAREGGGVGASVLNISSDKKSYLVGETAVIQLPKAKQGRALMTIETGSKILKQKWIDLDDDKTQFEVDINEDMAPNVYVSVSLIQPHKGKKNDRPIRLYGVVPLKVSNPDTKLSPIIAAPKETSPRSKLAFTVSEKNGKAMTYTVAMVDEGLLGLTGYKTPNLHKQFYKKEGLGVTTWDVFDSVVGAYGGELERLLAIGGGEDERTEPGQAEKKRFPPVVRFLGPFTLEAGQKKRHKIKLPQYIGAVRLMVVAGEKGSYGSAKKSIFVRDPLSILVTLPRVIGPSEELTVPVAIFVMDKKIKTVSLDLESDKHFKIIGDTPVKVRFNKPGEKMGFIKLKVQPNLGKGKLRFTARSRKHKTHSQIFIDVRSPNPKTVRQMRKAIKPGDTWTEAVKPHGITGTNKVTIEVSAVPPFNLERRLSYLVRYPHGCIEQTTSTLFPQLFLTSLVRLSDKRKKQIAKNIDSGIHRLTKFQVNTGGFVYWPGGFSFGGGGVKPWITSYVGHFLLEAKKLGYHVPDEMLNSWINYQRKRAKSWTSRSKTTEMDQAYRLYTLALAGKSELGAMNRLRESITLNSTARLQLAAAYKLSGLSDVSTELSEEGELILTTYTVPGKTYGSQLRDKSIMLIDHVTLGNKRKAKDLARDIAAVLASDKWHSTHTIAFSLLAMTKYIGIEKGKTAFTYVHTVGGKSAKISSKKPIESHSLDKFPDSGEQVSVKNTSKKTLFASILTIGNPGAGEEKESANTLKLDVIYTNSKGKIIKVSELKQGLDFKAKISITNNSKTTIDDIALTHIVASGWEIHNPRFDMNQSPKKLKIDYQDIRDDRIYSYFALKPGETKTISTFLNASYLGRYYLPGISAEAMYDASIQARKKGEWVQVVK